MANAAVLRAAHWEDHKAGGLQAEARSALLRSTCRQSAHFIRSREWGHGLDRAFVRQMADHMPERDEHYKVPQ